MTAEKIPLVALQKKEAAQQTKITAYGTLNSALSAFSAAMDAVNESKFNTAKATSSDATVATVTSKLGAATGSLSLKVDSLATNAKVASARVLDWQNAAATADSTIGTGTLTFTMGTATTTPAGFTADSGQTPFTVEIGPGQNTLAGIRDAVNAKGGAVTASIVNDGTGARLVFSSNATGAKNNFRIAADATPGAGGGPGLAQLAYNPAAPGNAATSSSQVTLGVDASLTIDGMAITSPSNTLTDTIDGLTITLLKGAAAGVPASTTIGVGQDNVDAKAAVNSLVSAYNTLLTATKKLSLSVPQDAGSSDARTDGPLSGDATIRSLMTQIKNQLLSPMDGATEPYTSLASIGVEVKDFKDGGALKLNEAVFDKAMAADRAAVTKLFTTEPNGEGSQGITAKLADTVKQMTASNGQVQSRIDGLTTITKQLQKQQTDMSARLVQIEARYRAQFTSLDTMLTSMDNTSSFLTQQLDALAQMRRQ
jgi:flagellar hook-associated protein 2